MQNLPASFFNFSRRLTGLSAVGIILILTLPLSGQRVGVNTEAPKAGFHVTSDDGILLQGTLGSGIVPDSGTGTRLLWIPLRSAFRAGTINTDYSGAYEEAWDPDNIGLHSFATGLNTRASGYGSFSHGDRNVASGAYSTSVGGAANIASGNNSFTCGLGLQAPSFGEMALGTYNLLYTPLSANAFESVDRIFTIGYGSGDGDRKNAVTVTKQGRIGLFTASPEHTVDIDGRVNIRGNRLNFTGTGGSIWIGENAGANEVDGGYANVLIGLQSGAQLTTGEGNISLGFEALAATFTGSYNVALGNQALRFTQEGTGNIGIGNAALFQNSTGDHNIALGYEAMRFGDSTQYNTAIGESSLRNLETGQQNIGIGRSSLGTQVTGSDNVAIGAYAGSGGNFNQSTYIGNESGRYATGSGNVFLGNRTGLNSTRSSSLYIDNSETETPLILGDFAGNKVTIHDSLETAHLRITHGAGSGRFLISDATGLGIWEEASALTGWTIDTPDLYNSNTGNVGIGTSNPAQKLHVDGSIQITEGRIDIDGQSLGTFIGHEAGLQDVATNQNSNTFVGYSTGKETTTGGENTAVGSNALRDNVTGGQNTAVGGGALQSSTSAAYNVAIGYNAIGSGGGSSNVSVGYYSLFENEGSSNIAIGEEAGKNNLTGNDNIFLGRQTGMNTTGSSNIFLGKTAGLNEAGSQKFIVSSHPTDWLMYGDLSSGDLTIRHHLESESMEALDGTLRDLVIDTGGISFTNSGESVFIGDGAGAADNRTNNRNVFMGYQAGASNMTGEHNIAIGHQTLDGGSGVSFNIGIGNAVLTSGSLTGQFNLGMGYAALENNTTGQNNIGLGQNALGQNLDGKSNLAIGPYALDANQSGDYNIGIGSEALGDNISGEHNIAMGYRALESNTGSNNTVIGHEAGLLNNGTGNVFLGYRAGYSAMVSNQLYISNSTTSTPLIHGNFSSKKVTINDSLSTKYFQLSQGAIQKGLLQSDASGRGTWQQPSTLFQDDDLNILIGEETGQNISTGNANTVMGAYAGAQLTTGYENTVLGESALSQSQAGDFNTAIGRNALGFANTGDNNTAIGWGTLAGTTGGNNTGLGAEAGGNNLSGSRNVYVGTEAGRENQGSDNVFIGYRAGKNETGNNKLIIENTDSATPLIQGDFSANTVAINNNLGVSTSDPKSTMDVNGSVGAKFKTPLVAGTTHPDATGMVWRYNSGTGTITLPGAGTCPNRIYVIINQTGSTRTISTYRDLVTNNQSTIGSSVALWLMSDGSEWWQIK